eukprot:gene10773-12551_t
MDEVANLQQVFVYESIVYAYIFHSSFNEVIAIDFATQSSKKELRHSYRLELVRSNDNNSDPECEWRLQLVVDPEEWFEVLSNDNQDMALDRATRALVPNNLEKLSKTVCSFKRKCDRRRDKDHLEAYVHTEWICDFNIPDKNGIAKHKCCLPVYSETIVNPKELGDKNFLPGINLLSRWNEMSRELMMIPTPDTISKNVFPHSNQKWVTMESFWDTARKICCFLERANTTGTYVASNRIVINHGQWETGARIRPNINEGHPHAHIWLSLPFVQSLDTDDCLREIFSYTLRNMTMEQIESDILVPRLKFTLRNHEYRPDDYVNSNAKSLELRIIPISDQKLKEALTQVVRSPPKKVFIVHGWDNALLESTKALLVGFGLEPVVLKDTVADGLLLMDKLLLRIKECHFGVVLMTCCNKLYDHNQATNAYTLKPTPRYNVFLELGMILSLNYKGVIVVKSPQVKNIHIEISDIQGVVYVASNDTITFNREIEAMSDSNITLSSAQQ